MALSAQVSRVDDPGKRRPSRSQATLYSATRKVALLGFGTVGRAVADILCRAPEPYLRLTHVFNRNVDRKRAAWVPGRVQWTENFQEILQSDADVIVELMGGLDPAHGFIRAALKSGKSVVTANKHVIAKYGPELLELARGCGVQLEYGAAVGGAVPVLAALRYGLSGDQLVGACGILNGTCNFILSNMEAHGATLAAAVAEAQRLGYAEADPSDDVNGVDAACKLAIVARHGLRADLQLPDIPRQSIANIHAEDFGYARQLGCTIRQVSMAGLRDESLQAAVGPALVSLKSPLASCVDNQNAVIFTGENSAQTVLTGSGAGGHATAVAVVSDLLAIAQAVPPPPSASLKKYVPEEFRGRHYLRLTGRNAGSLLSDILQQHEIRRERTLQSPHQDSAACILPGGTAFDHSASRQLATVHGDAVSILCLPVIEAP